MPFIWTSRTRDRQPQNKVELVSRYADAAMVVLPSVAGGLAGYGGVLTAVNLQPYARNNKGVGLATDQVGSYVLSSRNVSSWTGATVIAVQRPQVANNGWHQRLQQNDSLLSHWGYNGLVYLSTFTSTRWLSEAPPAAPLGQISTAVVTGKDNDHRAYNNGVLLGSSAGMYFGIRELCIGDGGWWGFGGETYLFVVLPRALSDGEAKDVSINPWQLFAPERRPVFYSIAGVSPGGSSTANRIMLLRRPGLSRIWR